VLRTSSHIKPQRCLKGPTDLLEAQRNHGKKAHEIESLTKSFMQVDDLRMQQKSRSLIIAEFASQIIRTEASL
jgi:hypothetical protein